MIKKDYFFKYEMLILALLNTDDLSFEDMTSMIKRTTDDYLHIKSGVLFTILYHLENAQLITHYLKNNKDYYHLENPGQVRYEMLRREYQNLNKAINEILNSQISEDVDHE